MAEIVVSQMDIEHLAIVRKNVEDTMALAVANHDKPGVRVLEIGPPKTGGAKERFKYATVTTLDIKPREGVDIVDDICEIDMGRLSYLECFDCILCLEVLEHALDPFEAAYNLWDMISEKGIVYVTTPFNLRMHGPLPDCWRFTEHALRWLFRLFDEIQITAIETPDRDLMPICYQTIVTKK
jgi:hypothetical protein